MTYYKKRRKLGLCISCRAKAKKNTSRCASCWKKKRKYEKRRKTNGSCCLRCGGTKYPKVNKSCLRCVLQFTAKDTTGHEACWRQLLKKFEKQKGICVYSGRKLMIGSTASLDHIVPKSRGGKNKASNLQWVHKDVNLAKSALSETEFLSMIKEIFEYRIKK